MKPTLRFLFSVLAAGVLLFAGRPADAQKKIDIPDPDPEIQRRALEVPDGFEINLFAADPLLAKPIQMNFDAAGRLWVATSELYPQIAPGQAANDKVIILEDTKGVGRADKVTVFADGLMIPTGIEPGDGGAYVANSTEIVHLKDTDGDGKADSRRVVLSGFGTEDTHHIIHTFRWGPDGMMYFNQSVYIHSHVETPHGVRRLGAGGIWQFRPETVQLEVFLHGFVNTWGHHFDAWGQSFVTDGAGGEGINHGVVGAGYMWAPGAARRLFGLNPGSPKYCGIEVLSGRHLPEAWRGNVVTNDFRAHRTHRFVLTEDGAGFTSRLMPDLIRTNYTGFRPIDVKMGPDGAIYIADWYNPIIQHGEVDFRDPRRDHTRGRIWRITAKGRPLVERPKLVGAAIDALLEHLKAPEDWTRHFAKRVLKERGAREVVPALAAWIKKLDAADPQHEHHLLEALWTHQSLDVPEPGLLKRVLSAKDHRARAAAARVIPHWRAALPDAIALAGAAATDEHPRVRLEGVRALARIPGESSMAAALGALDRPMEPLLDYALWLTARDLQAHWLPAVEAGKLDFGDPRKLSFALQAAGPAGVTRLMGLLRSGKIPAEQEENVLTLVAGSGGPAELAVVLDAALQAGTKTRRDIVLTALAKAGRERNTKPGGDLSRVVKLLDDADAATAAAAARAVGAWKLEPARARLAALAEGGSTAEPVRRAAMEGLAWLGGSASRAALDKLCAAGKPAAVRIPAVAALAALDLKAGAGRAVEVLADLKADDDPQPIFTALVQPRAGPATLSAALAGRKLPADVAKLGVRTFRAAGRDEAGVVEALTKAGGITGGPRTLTVEQMLKMVELVKTKGDPARGEDVYRRRDLACIKCHAVAGAGGRVGPGLESIGASAQIDYLIESLLLPDKAIKEGFHSLAVRTKDDRVLTGLLVRKNERELVIRDAEDREIAIAADNIDAQKPAGSLMPAGLIDNLTDAELIDLVRFMSELGKVGPYSVGRARLARTWQALESSPEARELYRVRGPEAAAGDDKLAWAPAYSRVSGVLPADTAPAIRLRGSETFAATVRARLEVTTAGKVKLLLNSPAGLSMWLGKAAVEPKAEMILDVPAGFHAITFAYDPSKRKEGLRLELEDAAGSPARAQIVGGK